MNHIEHLIEPDRLLLVWRPPLDVADRTWRIVAELGRDSEGHIEFRYRVDSDDFAEAQRNGFSGYPAFPISDEVYADGVMAAFTARIPPRTRLDFGQFLSQHAVPSAAQLSDFALLGYCGAMLPGDEFVLFHPFDGAPAPCELVLEVAGVRHHRDEGSQVRVGDSVSFVPEPENEFDALAIQLIVDEQTIGYVPSVQTGAFNAWLENASVAGVVRRVNGSSLRPRITVFVSITEQPGEQATKPRAA